MKSMNCIFCNHDVPEGQFCSNCGRRLRNHCSDCLHQRMEARPDIWDSPMQDDPEVLRKLTEYGQRYQLPREQQEKAAFKKCEQGNRTAFSFKPTAYAWCEAWTRSQNSGHDTYEICALRNTDGLCRLFAPKVTRHVKAKVPAVKKDTGGSRTNTPCKCGNMPYIGDKYCTVCCNPLQGTRCPACKARLDTSERPYCDQCGHPLHASPAPAPNEAVDCKRCMYFRSSRDVLAGISSESLGQGDHDNNSAINEAMAINRERIRAETDLRQDLIGKRIDKWPHRPEMLSYCFFGQQLWVHEIKNAGKNCKDFDHGGHNKTRVPCASCRHLRRAMGPDQDMRALEKAQKADMSACYSGQSPQHVNRWQQTTSGNKASEQRIFNASGVFANVPRYFDMCLRHSSGGRYVAAMWQNRRNDCEDGEE